MTIAQATFPFEKSVTDLPELDAKLIQELTAFDEFTTKTIVEETCHNGVSVPVFVNEFWTSKQRAGHNLHEISYRACFKSQLPEFFIKRLTHEGDLVLDPFLGRGTTALESVLLNRRAAGVDVSPLSRILTAPRLNPPSAKQVQERLQAIDLSAESETPEDLLTFYHKDTLREIGALRSYLTGRGDESDNVDDWIRMVATNRLTGHSVGYFSVYTLPPNQAVTVERQKLINTKHKQKPEYRDVKAIILKKSRNLLKTITPENEESFKKYGDGQLITSSADRLTAIPSDSVSLVVTSPPFLDVVQYSTDNWLRCWFNDIDSASVPIWNYRRVDDWADAMKGVFKELRRVLGPGGHVAFEVGEVRIGKIKLEEHVIPAAQEAGLVPVLVLVNAQEFTKTANCWGVDNKTKGTNTNRVVVLRTVE
ncbi:MAG: hypothetical protein ACJASX_001495 [Limisphaerales bacterium]|jgi:hypothetical protein